MTLTEKDICNLVLESVKRILSEGKQIQINRRKWEYINYENGERVLECTPKSILICSDDCSIRLIANKRYERPDGMNAANGWYNSYWKYLGWEVNAITYRNGAWVVFDKSFPRTMKNKEEVLNFIKRTRSFKLAKKELNLI